MGQAKDIILSVLGFLISTVGVVKQDQTMFLIGIIFIFVQISSVISEMEEDISHLQAQVNTQHELQKIWIEQANTKKEIILLKSKLGLLKNDKPKRKK